MKNNLIFSFLVCIFAILFTPETFGQSGQGGGTDCGIKVRLENTNGPQWDECAEVVLYDDQWQVIETWTSNGVYHIDLPQSTEFTICIENSGNCSATNQVTVTRINNIVAQVTNCTSANCCEVFDFPCPPLPVTWIYVDANYLERTNVTQIIWQTGSESNTKRFEVQASRDGSRWEYVSGTLAANSPTGFIYRIDLAFPEPGTMYYRIMAEDFDGTKSYSPMVSLIIDNDKPIQDILIYPSPAKINDLINIELRGFNPDNSVTFEVMDVHGKRVYQDTMENIQTQKELNIQILNAGTYFVRVQEEGRNAIVKPIIIQ